MASSTRQQRMRPAPRGRAGFTFIELIVGLAIVVLLAAVVTPAVTASIDRTRTDQGIEMLQTLADAFVAYHADINDYPSRLSQLNNPITTTMVNSCGTRYDNPDVNEWEGPYYQPRVLTSGGSLPVFVGTAQDDVVRIPSTSSPAYLGIVVNGVREEDLLVLDRKIDAGNGASAGTVMWSTTPSSEGLYTMAWFLQITGC